MKKRIRIGCAVWLMVLMGMLGCSRDSDIYLEEYGENEPNVQVTESDTQVWEETDGASEQEESKDTVENNLCYVYICGAVKQPGVYALPEGSRIYEVIEDADGLTADADETLVNQAEPVTDGMMVRIYTREEALAFAKENQNGEDTENQEKDGRININTATITELMTLPGIGSAKANAIVSYRDEYGEFSSIEDLMKVPGIKEGIFRQMKEHIKVND